MKLVILDRDGTINYDSPEYIKSADEWMPLPGALEAIARLNHDGWRVVVVTNQSGLGRGLFEVSELNDIHTKMHQQLAAVGGRIDVLFYCPHAPDDACHCRKPKAGLYEQVSDRYNIDLRGVPNVGDSARDLVAGAVYGCEPHLVLTGKGLPFKDCSSLPDNFPANTRVHADLAAFADFLLERDADAH